MHLIHLERSAKAQHESLCKIGEALNRHATQSHRVKNDKLRSLGVVKSTPLKIDNLSSCDFERGFFIPSYKDEHLKHALGADNPDYVTGLAETGRNWEGVWGESFNRKDPDDDEWLEPTPDQLPAFRFWWFARCLDDMQQTDLDKWEWWEDEDEQRQHESRTDGWRTAFSVETGDDTFHAPEREEADWDYRPLCQLQPRDPARPHFAVVMGDSAVARGAGEVLFSELHAAVEMAKRQLSCGGFSNHHTKPIIVYTLMSETHARITQAHFDAKTEKLVLRQSRVLDLRGKSPTPDAYLLLRWMMNTPVGETEYRRDAEHKIGGFQRRVPSQPSLVAAGAS